ncbi:hypothetical protein FS749_011874 [Ceratobasidium sp. UAMH 11750]|nr:hypothetical protein FS749_011874 [Ceratobasidium sp. UAMH 11750]
MATTVPKGDFVVVLKRALRDKETRELVAKELALYDAKDESSASTSRASKTKQGDETEIAGASLEERVADLEKTIAKQQAKINVQGQDLVRLWELMEGEISGHHGALAALLSTRPDYRMHSSGEDGEDSDGNEVERRERPMQTARRGKQTARKSQPGARGRGGRNV